MKIIATAEAENKGELYSTAITAGNALFIADEPAEAGGMNLGPAPGYYLCMSLASCKAITIRMYVKRKNWKVDHIKVSASLVKGDDLESGQNTFFCELSVTGDLTPEQQQRIVQIADACPVSRLLSKPSEVITTLRQ